MTRFYIAFGYILCRETRENFDGRLHMQELASCLSQLRELYSLREILAESGAGGGAGGGVGGGVGGGAVGVNAAKEFEEECEFSAYAVVAYQVKKKNRNNDRTVTN
jgi:hypothetical protein